MKLLLDAAQGCSEQRGQKAIFYQSVAVLIVLSASITCCGVERIDLPRAIELALRQNKTLARAYFQIDSARIGVDGAKVPFGFNIQPNGDVGIDTGRGTLAGGVGASKMFTWGTEVKASAELGNPAFGVDTNYSTLYSGTVSMEIRQPLLKNFGPLVNTEPIKIADSRLAEARRLVELQKVDLVVEVVRTYMDILRLKSQIDSAGQSAVRMKRLDKLTKAMERQGRTTHLDSLRSELQHGQALSQIEDYTQQAESAMKDFDELLGVDVNSAYELEPVPFIEENLPPVDKVADIALENRLDYAQILQNLRDADRGKLVARRGLLPDLDLILRYERFDSGDGLSEATRLGNDVWFVGLSSDMDLMRRNEHIAYRQAMVNGGAAVMSVEVIETGIRKQVQQHLLAYKRAIGLIKISRRNFELAKSRKNLSSKLFAMGRGDNFSVTDAEAAYMNAENQLLQAETESTLAGYQLRRSLGTLIEAPKDLLPPERNKKDAN